MPKMLTRTVSSWSELCDQVHEAEEYLSLRENQELWFRGITNRNHELLPFLFRCFPEKEPEAEAICIKENNLFFEFQAKARFTSGAAINDWDILFLMQHYGAPTRLLDWTATLHVAVYFATAYRDECEKELPRIYVMNPYKWNKKHRYGADLYSPRNFSWDEREKEYYDFGEILVDKAYIDWEFPCALYPPQRDARLSAQQGYFTIHGNDVRPLEEIAPKLLFGIDLDETAMKECEKQLKHSGVNEFTLFPDLEGLSRNLCKQYGYRKNAKRPRDYRGSRRSP